MPQPQEQLVPLLEVEDESQPATRASVGGAARRHAPKDYDSGPASHLVASPTPQQQHTSQAFAYKALSDALAVELRRQSLRFYVLVVLGIICLSMSLTTLLIFRSKDEFPPTPAQLSHTHSLTIRLLPEQNVISSLMAVVLSKGLRSASIGTAVGSLTDYNIRFANQNVTETGVGHFEVVSLVGTLTSINNTVANEQAGAWHIHIAIGDAQGTTISGHLASTGNIIYTTLEVTILYNCDVEYYRADDGTTGYDELQIRNATWC
jgi:uncharacterized protein